MKNGDFLAEMSSHSPSFSPTVELQHSSGSGRIVADDADVLLYSHLHHFSLH